MTACSPAEKAGQPGVTSERCHGVVADDVGGRAPTYGPQALEEYAVAPAVCAAWWVDALEDWFVPQSLEVLGDRVLVGGYRRSRDAPRHQPCQIVGLDPRSGRTLGVLRRWEAPVYSDVPTWCRHAGGMEADEHGLWVVESQRLWLLDPDRLFDGSDPVLRVWWYRPPVVGSTLVIDRGRIGLGRFRIDGPARMAWFGIDELLAPGVTRLPEPRRWQRVPQRLQGVARGPRGIWFSSSGTHCAELHAPDGRRLAFVPGAEDLEFVGPDLWTVSESGARYYLDPHERTVPAVLRLDASAVLAGPEHRCDW